MAAKYIHYGEDTLAMCRSTKRRAIITMEVARVTCNVCLDHLDRGIDLHRPTMNHLSKVRSPDKDSLDSQDTLSPPSGGSQTAQVIAHTDGAASPNPGPGGYGAVIAGLPDHAEPLEISQGFQRTTNNRMEILAVVAALEATPKGSHVTVYSDSRYVVDAVNKGWAKRWKSKGWMRNKKEDALNPDLWERLLTLEGERSVSLEWIRGHSGNQGNERADALAVNAARGRNLPEDPGYDGAPGLTVQQQTAAQPDNDGWKPSRNGGGCWQQRGEFRLNIIPSRYNRANWVGAIFHGYGSTSEQMLDWQSLGPDLEAAKRTLESELELLPPLSDILNVNTP